ncbi:uncharacterized protein [Apostichopus japonicus]|uniref:uncharacterized protein isoform X4 n=1 Tax=Stichopus japonicus TaxID=307972 RepID=UPI003AB8D9BB
MPLLIILEILRVYPVEVLKMLIAVVHHNCRTGLTDRSRGMQRAGMPHAENIKPQRDIYNNPRFCDVFTRLKGSVVFVQVKSGTEYEGILHTISPKGEIVLMEVRTKDQTKQKVTLHPKLILECNSIVKITAKDVNLDYSSKPESFATDAEISQRVNGQVPERKLEAWAPIEDDVADKRLLEVELDSTDLAKGNGWDAAEMFATNQRDFGYESTFKEDLQEYTTPLPEEDTKEFRERRARADRLAKQIEQSPEHANRGQVENSDDMTEEERFSSVSRVGMNSRPVPQNSSNNTDNRYVPPQKRQTGAGVYPRSGQGRKQSPSRTPMSGPGRPPVMGVDRQTPQAQAVVQTFRHTHQPSKQQQAPPPSAGQTGAMSSDYNRVQPHHSAQSQPKSQHHHSPVPQQPPYQQRPPVVGGVVGPRGQAPSLNPMGPKSLPPSIDNEQKRVAPQSEKQPLLSSEVALQRPDSLNHPNVDTGRSAAPNQIPSSSTTSEGQAVPDKSPARKATTLGLKNFSENLRLSTDKKMPENKVPALSTTLPPSTMEGSAEIISPSVTGGSTRPPAESPAQPEMKTAGTSPVIMGVPKKTPVPSTVEKDRTEAVKSQISEKPKLNPNAKVFIPRALPQKTPTPPPSRSPVSQLATNQMMAAAHYMNPSMAAVYGQGGPYMVTSNAPPGSLQQYTQIPKQVHAQRGTPRVEYMNSFPPALAAGQPLVTPIQGQQYITVTTGGQGMQQPGSIKVMPTMLNHVIKPTMSYRQLPNNNPAVQTMHPQSQQLVQGAEGVMLPQIMAFPSQAAAAQSQSLQQQHSQGSAPSNQYMHTAPSHANAANQMQQSHHTTPPLQQSQQSQSSNHPVIASQGQFPQHGGRPSPGPMQPQMTHAQAQAQVVQPQGGMAQLVAVSQGGQQAIVYTSLPQTQHGHGIPTQHASQQYSNIPQHINQQPNMQVQPTHVPSNMTNITNVTRVHPDPHPHPHPAAPTLYMNQSQAGMVQSHQLPGSYLQQHGAAYQPGN